MTDSLRVVLLANGELRQPEYTRSQIAPEDIVIAADGGTRVAYDLGITPHLIIGDIDSLPPDTAQWVAERKVPTMQYPAEKDQTDLELAIDYAIDLKPREILFIGITGSRTDHMLANFSVLGTIAARGIHAQVIVGEQHIHTVTDEILVSSAKGPLLSLLPWGGDARGISTNGLKWELNNEDLTFGTARGISNLIIGAEARVYLKAGLLLVIQQPIRVD